MTIAFGLLCWSGVGCSTNAHTARMPRIAQVPQDAQAPPSVRMSQDAQAPHDAGLSVSDCSCTYGCPSDWIQNGFHQTFEGVLQSDVTVVGTPREIDIDNDGMMDQMISTRLADERACIFALHRPAGWIGRFWDPLSHGSQDCPETIVLGTQTLLVYQLRGGFENTTDFDDPLYGMHVEDENELFLARITRDGSEERLWSVRPMRPFMDMNIRLGPDQSTLVVTDDWGWTKTLRWDERSAQFVESDWIRPSGGVRFPARTCQEVLRRSH